jgi:hypothetical protein
VVVYALRVLMWQSGPEGSRGYGSGYKWKFSFHHFPSHQSTCHRCHIAPILIASLNNKFKSQQAHCSSHFQFCYKHRNTGLELKLKLLYHSYFIPPIASWPFHRPVSSSSSSSSPPPLFNCSALIIYIDWFVGCLAIVFQQRSYLISNWMA